MLVVATSQGCAVYTQIVFLTWLPSYLVNVKQLSIMKSGIFTALPYFIATALAWVLGYVSDRWLEAKGCATTGQRRLVVVLAMLSAAVVLLAPLVDNVGLTLGLITVSLTGLATGISLNIAPVSDLLRSPRTARRRWQSHSGGNILSLRPSQADTRFPGWARTTWHPSLKRYEEFHYAATTSRSSLTSSASKDSL